MVFKRLFNREKPKKLRAKTGATTGVAEYSNRVAGSSYLPKDDFGFEREQLQSLERIGTRQQNFNYDLGKRGLSNERYGIDTQRTLGLAQIGGAERTATRGFDLQRTLGLAQIGGAERTAQRGFDLQRTLGLAQIGGAERTATRGFERDKYIAGSGNLKAQLAAQVGLSQIGAGERTAARQLEAQKYIAGSGNLRTQSAERLGRDQLRTQRYIAGSGNLKTQAQKELGLAGIEGQKYVAGSGNYRVGRQASAAENVARIQAGAAQNIAQIQANASRAIAGSSLPSRFEKNLAKQQQKMQEDMFQNQFAFGIEQASANRRESARNRNLQRQLALIGVLGGY